MVGDSVRASARPLAARRRLVAELVAGMTIAEKIGQLTGVALGRAGRPDGQGPLGPGSIAPGIVAVLAQPLGEMARQVAELQAHIAATSRLRIPALALARSDATDLAPFPAAVALAATWNAELAGRVAASSAAVLAGAGLHAMMTPSVAAALRPAPWPDVAASPGDDGVLGAEIVRAFVLAVQGPTATRLGPGRLAAALPDFGAVAGQAGRRTDHAWSERSLRATVLASAEGGVRAGAAIVLPAPVGNDGVPGHADSWLLRDVLREWGFDGVVVASLAEVTALAERYHVAEAPDGALALAIEAGIHMVVAPQGTGGVPRAAAGTTATDASADVHRRLTRLLVEGRLSGWVVDAAVTQVLMLKVVLGLLDEEPARPVVPVGDERYPLAEAAVVESMVLLTDPAAILPLTSQDEAVVVAAGPVPETVAVRAMVAALAGRCAGGARVLDGASWTAESPDATAPLLPAGDGPVIVLVDEPPGTERLVGRLVATGRPCVVLVCGGDPRTLGPLIATTAAIVLCWQPVTVHAAAVAGVLVGDAEPGGRLPMAITGDDGKVLFPLGHGTGYTRFEYSHLRIGPDRTPDGALVVVQCRITNTGTRPGKEVVQVYVRDEVATVSRAGSMLAAFTTVTVEAGRTATVTLRVPAERVALWDRGMRHVVEPGSFTVLVGRSAADVRLRGTFTVDLTRDLTPPRPDR